MRKSYYVISVIFVSLLIFGTCGCISSSQSVDVEAPFSSSTSLPVTLWVVTEQTPSGGMNTVVHSLADQFEAEHDNVTIQIDILPTANEERTAYLKTLNSSIALGKGPDIFILPTKDTLVRDMPQQNSYVQIEPIISDVEIAMRSGLFSDIQLLYSMDTQLAKSSLEQTVMDAGMVGNSRFVLPLRYDIPVVYMFKDDAISLCPSIDLNGYTISEWIDFVITLGNPVLACGAEYASLNVFSNLIDYDTQEVIVSEDEIIQYFKRFQMLEALIGTEVAHRSSPSLDAYTSGIWTAFPVHIDSLEYSPIYAAIAEFEGKSLAMYPLRSNEGDVIASVCYYGAVGANCSDPEMAYSFLRMFLMEDAQWTEAVSGQYSGLIERGWPVLVPDSVESIWNSLRERPDFPSLFSQIELTNTSIPILSTKIDIVRFPFSNDFYKSLFLLNSYSNGNLPSAVDIQELSSNFINSLQVKFTSP